MRFPGFHKKISSLEIVYNNFWWTFRPLKVNTILYFSLSSHTNNSDQHLFKFRSGSSTKLFADPDRDPGFATTLRTEFSHLS